MGFNFPDTPAPNEIFTVPGGPTWRFNDGVWQQIAQLETIVVINPVSLATGASTAIATVTIIGILLGDIVKASFSLSLAGATLTAWVSSTNTVSYFFTNVHGVNPLNLGSGTLKIRIEK